MEIISRKECEQNYCYNLSMCPIRGSKVMTQLVLQKQNLSNIIWLTSLKTLTLLDLSNNVLTCVPSLINLRELTSINLSGNRLTKMPELPISLEYVDLSDNSIQYLQPITILPRLTTLNISGNMLESFDAQCCEKMPDLQNLYVSGNADLHTECLHQFNELRWLNIINNSQNLQQILSLCHQLYNLERLYINPSLVTKDSSGINFEALDQIILAAPWLHIINEFLITDEYVLALFKQKKRRLRVDKLQ